MLSDPLGGKLRKKRLSKNIELDVVEASIGIQKKHLIAIEGSRYEKLPGRVYVDNFIKKYASYLGFDTEDCLSEVEKEYKMFNDISSNSFSENMNSRFVVFKKPKNILSTKFFFANNILKNIVIAFIFLLCFAYLGVEAMDALSSPNIKIYSPDDNMVLNTRSVFIEGEVDGLAKVYINDKEILTNNAGIFAEDINLHSGVNIIKFSANKKYGKPSIVYRKVLVVENKNN